MDMTLFRAIVRERLDIDAGAELCARQGRVGEAIELLKARKFSELPVVDSDGRPVGMLDITDLIGLDPTPAAGETRPVLRLADRKTA